MLYLILVVLLMTSSAVNFVRRVSIGQYEWNNVFQNLIPSLHQGSTRYKGQNGRILVIGGSRDYTGATYYAGQSALKYGADLATVLCSKEASIPIKSYSPELMVTPLYDDNIFKNENHRDAMEEVTKIIEERLQRAHVLVIGPGLGRGPISFIFSNAILLAIKNDIP